MRTVIYLIVLVVFQYGAAQSLPPCAKACVSKTKTHCKSTDFLCACSDEKYLPHLTKCIEKRCDGEKQTESFGYLSSLCAAVGVPIVNSTVGYRMELRDLEQRQFVSDFESSTRTTRTQGGTATATPTDATTEPLGTTPNPNPNDTGSSNNAGENKSGLSMGAKVGLGLGIPLGLIIIGGLIGLGFWFGRHSRSKPTPANGDQLTMTGPTGPSGPAELDQSAQYIGHEMPTMGNTVEMPGGPPVSGYSQPTQGWQQQKEQLSTQLTLMNQQQPHSQQHAPCGVPVQYTVTAELPEKGL
ncbi:hypothetical protein BS50DRAFT_576719 [Corynespora cassiicola Philippines]|uniref:CFEM domain-containing protein n=1 Tax=Corynespora cassiicola Philippines TaxID=1448308 RepID=A0A2T2NGE9_CORCC|nr:hypothetical protein BS50DRAFT_576719 [Corynespora cassiicola Philippines]